MRKRLVRILVGIMASNCVALLLFMLTWWLTDIARGGTGIFVTSIFVLIPTLMGIISAFCWRKLDLSSGEVVGWSTINLVIAYAISYLFLGEGVICLIMALPLVAGFLGLGTMIGRSMFRSDGRRRLEKSLKRYHVSIVPLLV